MIQIYTGNGKGKTTAALGMIIRSLGHGKRVCLIQFMKRNSSFGEIQFLNGQQNLEIYQYGTDKLIDPQHPDPVDFAEASAAISRAYEVLTENQYDLVVLDEINVAVKWKLISPEDQLEIFNLAAATEVIMTGRYASEEVMARADLVTEMKEIKHYFIQDIKARAGIEF